MSKKAIGIIGGVGPLAGIDLAKKVFSHTKADKDQDHIDMYLVSCPSIVPDRTSFLLNGTENPMQGIQTCMNKLAQSGATAVGICCNTAHSPKIIGALDIPENVQFINMIDKTCQFISDKYKTAKIGLIATLGTIQTGIYDEYFAKYPSLELVKADQASNESVHQAIYDKEFGIKANSGVTEQAFKQVNGAVMTLKAMGCKAVILGCTELPLVYPGKKDADGVELIDPTDVLAIELIKATEPEKLIF